MSSPSRPRTARVMRVFARVSGALLAFVGLLPVLLTIAIRIPTVNRILAARTAHLIDEQGVKASYAVELHLWPISASLEHIRVESTDGGPPALTAERLTVKPRFFSLLAGKPTIDEIALESPDIRVVLSGKHISNLGIDLPESKGDGGPFEAPFSVIAASDAHVDFTLDQPPGQPNAFSVGAKLEHADIDLLAHPGERGSDFDAAIKATRLAVQTERTPDGSHVTLVDEDELCDLDGRVDISQAGRFLIRRFEAHGGIDNDGQRGTFPGCDLSKTDKRRVDLSIGHLAINLPEGGEKMPSGGGRFSVRVPLGVIQRVPGAPPVDGWFSIEAKLQYDPKRLLPDAEGRFEVSGVKVGERGVVEDAAGDFAVKDDVVRIPELAVHVAHGVAKVTDVEVRPVEPGIPLSAGVHVQNAELTQLLVELGIHPHPHVGWDLQAVDVAKLGGTLVPLELRGFLEAKSGAFGVYDAPFENEVKHRFVGFQSAKFHAGVHIQPEALEFVDIAGVVPGAGEPNTVGGAFVSIGFHGPLKIVAPSVHVHLADIGPIGSMPIEGLADVHLQVDGDISDPHLTAGGRIEDFTLGSLALGTIEPIHAELNGLTLSLRDVGATKGQSDYGVPYARLEFGGQSDVDVEADVETKHLELADFFDMFGLTGDPRFQGLGGILGTETHLRVTMGGPQDKCGGGLIEVGGDVTATNLNLAGEHFDEGQASFDLRWYDQAAGLRGADLTVRTVTLHKVHKPGQAAVGTATGSVTLGHGGNLHGNAVFESLPLSSLDNLGAFKSSVSGNASGLVLIEGDLDAFEISGNVDVTPIRIRQTLLDSSALSFRVRQAPELLTLEPGKKQVAPRKSRCGLPIGAAFDPARYAAESKLSQGSVGVSGSLFGGQIRLDEVAMTREPSPRITGKLSFAKLDLAKVIQLVDPPTLEQLDEAPFVKGELTGDLVLDDLRPSDLAHSHAELMPRETQLFVKGQKIVLKAPEGPIVLGGDRVTLPKLVVALASGGVHGSFAVQGQMSKLDTTRALDLSAELEPIDLAILSSVVPKVTRSSGKLSGSVHVGGTASAPAVAGHLAVRDGSASISGVPGVVTDITMDLDATESEVSIRSARAKFAGGTLAVAARMPVRGSGAGTLESSVVGRDLHYDPVAGVRSVFDCDLSISGNLFEQGISSRLPRITGSVLLGSAEYTRPINLDLTNNLAGGAKRTAVEAYDPDGDVIAFDINVRSKTPLRVKNNLADFQLALEGDGLTVTGTNQRVGLRGELRAVQGGKLRFLSNDFDLRQASIRFEDPTRVAPYVDLLAVTEYRRVATTTAAGAGRAGGTWRISLHAYGPAEELKLDMTSEPTLTREDISLLLTVGLTKAEADSLGGNALQVIAYEAAGTATGADRAVKKVVPIDDFRFGSAYSPRTGRSEPNLTVGKRLSKDVMANVTSGFTEDRAQKATIEWRLSRQTSVQASYDNINNISSTGAGNVGMDFRWRLEFQ